MQKKCCLASSPFTLIKKKTVKIVCFEIVFKTASQMTIRRSQVGDRNLLFLFWTMVRNLVNLCAFLLFLVKFFLSAFLVNC